MELKIIKNLFLSSKKDLETAFPSLKVNMEEKPQNTWEEKAETGLRLLRPRFKLLLKEPHGVLNTNQLY
jgi:hypothetical protein